MTCLSIVNQVVQQDACQTFAPLLTVVHYKLYSFTMFFYFSHKQIYFSLLSVIILISIVQYQRDLQNTLNKQTSTCQYQWIRIQYEQKQGLKHITWLRWHSKHIHSSNIKYVVMSEWVCVWVLIYTCTCIA